MFLQQPNSIAHQRETKLSARNRAIQEFEESYLNEPHLYPPITRLSAREIVAKITLQKDLTCEFVMKAFIWNAIQAHRRTNCLTEVMFEEALLRAKQFDAEFALKGTIKGALHGVPISLKDNIQVKGYDSTNSLISRAFLADSFNNPIVDAVIEAGCIPFVKTNVPQTLLSYECSNPLWGATTNPHNSRFTCGGSSGGEAALIASQGSIIGIGNDIGGSLRIPAHFCGIYSLKPTVGRVNDESCRFSVGQCAIKPCNGPMASSMDNLEMLMRAIVNPAYSEVPIPWRKELEKKEIRIGYMLELDAELPTAPACKRALQESVEKLQNAGVSCEQVHIPNLFELATTFISINCADATASQVQAIGKEPLDPHISKVIHQVQAPSLLKRAFLWYNQRKGASVKYTALLQATTTKRNLSQYWRLVDFKAQLQKATLQAMSLLNVDCILFPAFATQAIPLNCFSDLVFSAAYSFVWNVLDVPVGMIPAGKVESDKDGVQQCTDYSQTLTFMMSKCGLLDSKESEGLPIGVQIVGVKRFDEERLLGCMKTIDRIIN